MLARLIGRGKVVKGMRPYTNVRNYHQALLSNRSIIRASGRDSEKLLQNLTTNDLKKINVGEGQLTGFLNPQGRTTSFAFLYKIENDEYLIELDQNVTKDTLALIKKFKLRSKITLDDVSERMGVRATWSSTEEEQQTGSDTKTIISIQDQRSPNMGSRSIIEKPTIDSSLNDMFEAYTVHRITQDIPETYEEIVIGGMPLEANLDLMKGVDFRKGCYIGQELTARTHHTGVIRKRIVPVNLDANLDNLIGDESIRHQSNAYFEGIQTGLDIRSEPIDKESGNSPSRGRSAGKLLSCTNNVGLAMLRLEQVHRWNKDLTMKVLVGDQQIFVRPFIPDWWPEEVKQPQTS